MKILELNDIANVPRTFTKYLNKLGEKADYYPQNHTGIGPQNLDQYDIIHAHYGITSSTIKTAIRKKIILHLHGCDVRRLPYKYKPILWFLKMRAKTILYSTPDLNEYTEGTWIPNPVDIEMFKPKNNPIYDDKILIFCPTVHPVKRWDIITKVVKLLPEFEFHTHAKIKTNLKNIKKLDWIPYEKIPELLSRYPLVLGQMGGICCMADLEAMAMGIPTMVYLSPRTLNYYSFENPSLPKNDPEYIAKKIKKHINDRKLGDKQRNWVKKHHGAEKITKNLLKIFKETSNS